MDDALTMLAAQLAVVALAVVAVMSAAKHAVPTRWLDSRPGQVALRLAPLVLGALAGWAGGVEAEPVAAALLGLVAGASSQGIYRHAKGVVPGLVLAGEDPRRGVTGQALNGVGDGRR